MTQSQLFSRRAFILTGVKATLLLGLTGRLVHFQILQSDRYKLLAEENRINVRLLPPIRGRVYDRNGIELAGNRQTYRAVLVAEEAENVEETLKRLSELVNIDQRNIEKAHKILSRQPKFIQTEIIDNLDWAEVSRIEAHRFEIPGIHINTGQSRIYHYGSLFAHNLGYVSSPTEEEVSKSRLFELPNFKIGKRGLEKYYDDTLRGKGGVSRIEVNASGRVIKEVERDSPKPGENLWLSLDVKVQEYVTSLLKEHRRAVAVVMHVRSGEVLAMVSTPSFNPNLLSRGLNESQWQALLDNEDHPLTDRAVSGFYAPGSVYKMVVMMSALENGMPAATRFLCSGFLDFGRNRFHCWKRSGHGDINMVGALRESCDVWFYNAGRLLGVDRIAYYARMLGAGVAPDIDLPDVKAGIVPTKKWKIKRHKRPWLPGETLVNSIGQGYLLMTPLQICSMTARLATGRQVEPKLKAQSPEVMEQVRAGFSAFQPLPVNESNLEIIRRGMIQVVNSPSGTAYGARIREKGYLMAGKTGTVQVRRISTRERKTGVLRNADVAWKKRDHALFAGYAPHDNPEWAVAVVVEHGGSGAKVAAPIARDILHYVQKRHEAGHPPPLSSDDSEPVL